MSEYEQQPQMGHYQVFREGAALSWVSNKFRRRVRGMVLGEPSFAFGATSLDSLIPDIERYHHQAAALAEAGVTPYAAIFTDAQDRTARLPVPVIADPGSEDLVKAYLITLEILGKGGLTLEPTEPAVLREAFVDRLAEYATIAEPPLGAGLNALVPDRRLGSGGRAATIVTTNREDDIVLVCQGFFASTATAFGVSNPAVGELEAGRYSFGIVDGEDRRFNGVIWTCPDEVKLPLPAAP